MALKIKGNNNTMELQPGWEIVETQEDTLVATLTFKGPYAQRMAAPQRGALIPTGDPLYCHERRMKRLPLGLCEVRCDFIGILADPTPFRVEFPGGTGTEAIELHDQFEDFAGTADEPNEENGAKFDPETNEFIGFTAGPKRGMKSYYVPNTIVNVSYWTFRAPQPRRITREILASIPGLIVPSSVKDFLLIGMPFRQVGPLWGVTEQYLGSGPNGWDTDVYGR